MIKTMVIEKSISLEEPQAEFLNSYASLGFRSEHELLAEALHLLQQKLEQASALVESAELYTDVYQQDTETQEWTKNAAVNWLDHE